jgi:2-amino-4-hydroxy-6-hydroxymethyldihydropteridine diphosphokinase
MRGQSPLVFVSFGSNVGDSLQILENALTVVEQHGAFTDVVVSGLYRTRAVGPAQPDYVNGAFRARTDLAPREVLAVLHFIEDLFGRVRQTRWGPRTLDLDLLFHGDTVLTAPDLVLPHPGIEERGFVLAPLVELDPTWTHPVTGRAVLDAWQRWQGGNPDALAQVASLDAAEAAG